MIDKVIGYFVTDPQVPWVQVPSPFQMQTSCTQSCLAVCVSSASVTLLALEEEGLFLRSLFFLRIQRNLHREEALLCSFPPLIWISFCLSLFCLFICFVVVVVAKIRSHFVAQAKLELFYDLDCPETH